MRLQSTLLLTCLLLCLTATRAAHSQAAKRLGKLSSAVHRQEKKREPIVSKFTFSYDKQSQESLEDFLRVKVQGILRASITTASDFKAQPVPLILVVANSGALKNTKFKLDKWNLKSGIMYRGVPRQEETILEAGQAHIFYFHADPADLEVSEHEVTDPEPSSSGSSGEVGWQESWFPQVAGYVSYVSNSKPFGYAGIPFAFSGGESRRLFVQAARNRSSGYRVDLNGPAEDLQTSADPQVPIAVVDLAVLQ